MALDFTAKDVIHKITAKFVHAFLPERGNPPTRAALSPSVWTGLVRRSRLWSGAAVVDVNVLREMMKNEKRHA
ncbi:MAG: hypothetical protein LBF60_03980 [Treponema sp.]|jgi:hypothetical protein|nr:hypothetical protein [Treponema sp.]